MGRVACFLSHGKKGAFLLFAALFFFIADVRGVILYRTGDPTANTTAPTGDLAGSGWQYEGTFGSFIGTPIAPHFFITAQHIGFDSDKLVFQGTNYTIVNSFSDASSDLRIFQVAETFPIYAPLYTGVDEVGKHLVVIGRGKQRSAAVTSGGTTHGWIWGTTDQVQRWGENTVAAIKQISPVGDMIYATFDGNGLTNEAHLANGDSGGGVFVDDGGVWKLAGINYDVDGPFYTSATATAGFYAAMFDERGFYSPSHQLVSGSTAVPSGWYASRVSARLSWIYSVINPQLANISARATVGVSQQVAIAGFIIKGDATQTQHVVLRGLGPSLQVNGTAIPGRLDDPVIELHGPDGTELAANDNWRDGANATEIQSDGLAPADDAEAVLSATLAPGNYTAVLSGASGSTGVGLIEVYELDSITGAPLLNLSARAFVGSTDSVLIGGLIVESSERLLLRAIGPSLAQDGVDGSLQDPSLELHDANGQLLASNDNWQDAPNAADINATGLAPNDSHESAILVSPGPGQYTAIVSGIGNDPTGIALVEAYLIQ